MILRGFENIHNSVKTDIATPSRLVALVNLYIKFYEEKLKILGDKQDQLKVSENIIVSIYIFVFLRYNIARTNRILSI